MNANIDEGYIEKTYLYHQLDEYPWDDDQEFQGGLGAILGSVQDPDQIEHLTLRAKCYYFARKSGTAVDFDGYKQWVENTRGRSQENGTLPMRLPFSSHVQTDVQSANPGGAGVGGMADAPKPASFAEICDMIAEGKPIPGIKDIPDTILEGQASESQKQTRRKPWEKDASAIASESRASWMSAA